MGGFSIAIAITPSHESSAYEYVLQSLVLASKGKWQPEYSMSDFEQAISKDIEKENLDLYVFAATDIINSNSKIISLGNDAPVVEKAFGVSVDNNTAMLENVVSRKKQILPNILNNFISLKSVQNPSIYFFFNNN